MAKVIFVHADDSRSELEGPPGMSIMELATSSGIDEIIGECGGSAMCGTCHVYVDAAFLDRLPPPSAVEDEMLECTAAKRRPESRLGCQIRITDTIHGIILRLPERQT